MDLLANARHDGKVLGEVIGDEAADMVASLLLQLGNLCGNDFQL